MPFEVRTPVFDGPLDLLLHLVVGEQVDLYEVPISRVVDAYLAHLEGLEQLELEVATEFLLVAAALVELKVRRLLPGPVTLDVDEEVELWSQRDVLLARLLECRTYKQTAQALQDLALRAGRSRPRAAGMEERFASLVPDALAGISPQDLRSALERALTPRPSPRVQLDHVTPVRVSVRDAVAQLSEELPGLGETSFRRLTNGLGERLQVIVRFLAVLELYKEGLVELAQGGTFGELRVRWLGDRWLGEGGRLVPESVGEYQG
ncbi:MAG: segregation/condensation protein A [Actinomycetota bacterium]|nr:segregation/condensation protein A [Actinomycetota bacterium]